MIFLLKEAVIVGGIVGVVALIIKLIRYFFDIEDWKESCEPERPKISFEKFKNFYLMAPEKYELLAYCVKYSIPGYYDDGNRQYHTAQRIYIDFETYKDYQLYCDFKQQLKQNAEKATQLKVEADLINYVKQDIENFKAKAEAEAQAELEKIQKQKEQVQEFIFQGTDTYGSEPYT